jgi:hypothetical protein
MPFAVSESIDATERALLDAFAEQGWEPMQPGKPAQVLLSLHEHRDGCVIREAHVVKTSWSDTVGPAFGRRVAREGGRVWQVLPGLEHSEVVEWNGHGDTRSTVGNPAGLTGRGSLEDQYERIARAQVAAIADAHLGPSRRRPKRTIGMRLEQLAPVDEVLSAIHRGLSVTEMDIEGNVAFRFPVDSGAKMVVLHGEDVVRIRQAIRDVNR